MRLGLSVLVLVVACACRTTTSPIGFQGFRVRSVTPDFAQKKLAVHVSLDFRVRNPLSVALVIPEHTYTIKLGATNPITQRATAPQTTVPGNQVKVLSYDIDVDIS